MIEVNLIYTTNRGHRYEKWFKADAKINTDITITVMLPKGTTHYIVNLIDEHNFLVSSPEIQAKKTLIKGKKKYSNYALSNK